MNTPTPEANVKARLHGTGVQTTFLWVGAPTTREADKMAYRNRRVTSSMIMTPDQEHAQAQLLAAIGTHLTVGHRVPCTEDAPAWDRESTPVKVCAGCPVLDLCYQFALTGAITEGIIGGIKASELSRQRRQRPLTLVA